jgi:predicted oxidoreductase (fatty acid repression mutant protein)
VPGGHFSHTLHNHTFFQINYSKVIFHNDRFYRTNFYAGFAGYTANFTGFGNSFAPVMRTTEHQVAFDRPWAAS